MTAHRGLALGLPLVAVLVAGSKPVALAQADPAAGGDGEQISLETLLDLVVTATLRMQSILEAPASITVVSASEIRAHGYRTLKAIMNDVPGFNDVSDTNEEIVAVRGVFASTTNKILILINGHRMNDLMLGRYNVDQFLGMESVERVEFIRGPVSALYGTGALVGVVNVITKRGAELDGVQAKLQAGLYAQEGSLSWGKPLMGHDVFFNFTFLNAMGQTVHQDARLDVPPPERPRQPGSIYLGRYRENLSGLLTVRSDNSSLVLRGAHFRRAAPRGSTGSFYDFDHEPYKPTYTENDFFVDYSYTWTLGPSGKTRLTLNPGVHFFSYFEQSVINYAADRLAPVGERGSHQDEFNNYQLKLTLERPLRDDLDLIVGLDGLLASFYRSDAVTVQGDQLVLIPEGNTTTGWWFLGGAFMQAVYAPRKFLSLTTGLRYDTFQNEAHAKLTPRLGLVYRPLPALALKTLYGRSYLAPMWAHKRANDGVFIGRPDLDPESFEGADFIAAYGDRRGSATFDLFYNRVTGLINSAVDLETGKAKYQNSPVATAYLGFELAGEVQLSSAVRLQGSYSYIRPTSRNRVTCTAKELMYPPSDRNCLEACTAEQLTLSPAERRCVLLDPALAGDRIKNIPQHTFRYGLRLEPAAGLVLSIWGRAYTATRTSDPITGKNTIAPVALLDASLMYTWRKVTLQVIGNNLTNRYYEIGGTVPRPLARPGLDVQGVFLLRL
jgi:iron complex outermembrane receptor protein